MKSKHKLIGVCGASLFDQNAIQFLSALREIAFSKSYTTIAFSACIESMDDITNPIAETELLDLCRHIDLDCLIILTETLKNKHLIHNIVEIGKSKNIPVFSIDGEVEGCYNMPLNYKSGFRNMVRHVILDHGATRVNMLAGMHGNAFSEERVDIYKEVLDECGIPFESGRLGYGEFWSRPARVALQKFIHSDLETPQAIICANDAMAMTACAVLSEYGYRIPEDIIVTGFDGTPSAKHHYPAITTCEPDYDEALRFIIEQTELAKNTGHVTPCEHMINFKVIKSQSCGCEPNNIHNNNRIISDLYEAVGDSSWHTIAMNALVKSVFEKNQIENLVELLPGTVRLWSDHFRFACIKSELMSDKLTLAGCRDISGKLDNMTTMLHVANKEFTNTYVTFDVKDFIPNFDQLVETAGTTFVARILKNGKQVYGYTVDEYDTLDHRQLQRSDEFAMFLTHCINTVLHNFELTQLNKDLEKAYEDIAALSIYDPMTGIYNRRGFFKVLQDNYTLTGLLGKYLYIANIDLDGLKYINDNFGHKEGDFAITAVAHSLSAIQAEHLVCARFGGDEFTCLFLSDTPDSHTTEQIKEQVANALANIPGVSDKKYPLRFSIGLCCQQITRDPNIENIISLADEKMYADKAEHKRIYTSQNQPL